jgi:hypothetical protein
MAKFIDTIDGNAQRAVNFADPSSAQDLATKQYVDNNNSSPARATATQATSSLAAGATDSTTTIMLAKGYRLYSIQTSRPARVRLYETAAQKTADLARAVGTDPAGDAGVVLDYVTTDTAAHTLSPLVDGANLESSPSTAISMAVTNNDTSTGSVTVTLVWIKAE